MHKTVYDVLYRRYKLHRRLPPAEEQLTQSIIASGKMRLDADNESNFVRILLPAERINMTFTRRELEGELQKHSFNRLYEAFSRKYDGAKATQLASAQLERAREEMRKRRPVSAKTELMIARAFVLCNAYPVIRLLHLEGAEIYISFGNSVGDVMDVARWVEVGGNSGLQAVGGGENAVYVSCGGHPFLDKEEYRHYGDGPPALARFMIIAAQETGHNGDLIRGKNGQWIGRHSAVDWGRAPTRKVGEGRFADLGRTERAWLSCQKLGMNRIASWEQALKFYRAHKLYHTRRLLAWIGSKLGWLYFKLMLRSRRMMPLGKLQRSPYPCLQLQRFFPDMLFNLAPVADVYARKDPREEEAIACIEALARVPQQVVKWGHASVRFCTPQLYKVYYRELVIHCDKAANLLLTK